MEAMIKNDEEKVWMTPLLELRNELDKPDDRDRRDFRRMNGQVQLFHDRTIPGPYTKEWREHWLRRVLEAQQSVRRDGPAEFRDLQLITPGGAARDPPHLAATRSTSSTTACRGSTRRSTGEPFPKRGDDGNSLRADDWELLRRSAAATRRSSTSRSPCSASSGSSGA